MISKENRLAQLEQKMELVLETSQYVSDDQARAEYRLFRRGETQSIAQGCDDTSNEELPYCSRDSNMSSR
jgi:hypothetical protein